MTSNSMHGGSHDEAMQAWLSLAQKVVVVCEDQASFIRVSQWILPKHVHVTVSAESLPSLLQHEKSQGQTDDGSEAEMIVVFSNKNVQPLIEAACLC